MLSEEPSLKDRVLSFFRGANKKYSFEPGMTKAAKKWLSEYKKLFNEVSAYNKGQSAVQNAVASEGVRKIERIGRVVGNGAIEPNTIENGSYGNENGVSNNVRTTADNKKVVGDSGERYAIKLFDEISDKDQNIGNEIADFIDGVNSMVDESKKNKRKKRIGVLSDSHVKIINNLIHKINPDFSAEGYELWIDGISAQHIEQRHGKNGEADNTMASREEKALIPWAAQNAETGDFVRESNGNIRYSSRFFNNDNSHAPEIRLTKKTDEGTVFVSECVPDSTNKRIWITSAYTNKNGSKGQLLNIEDKSSPQPTPEASFDSNATKVIIPDSEGKSNSFDENSSKKVNDGSSSSTAAGGPPSPILGKAKVDDGSRSALKRGGSVASELTKLKGAVSDLNIDPVNLMALSDRYFERYDGKKSRSALRIELMDAARLMADSKDPEGIDKGYDVFPEVNNIKADDLFGPSAHCIESTLQKATQENHAIVAWFKRG